MEIAVIDNRICSAAVAELNQAVVGGNMRPPGRPQPFGADNALIAHVKLAADNRTGTEVKQRVSG